MGKLTYEPLSAEHEFLAFSCGDSNIDNYIKKEAYADQCRAISSTTVVKYEGKIVGVFTTRCTQIEIQNEEKVSSGIYYDRYWPAIEVTYFAIDKNYQNQGFGMKMLKHLILRVVITTQWLGVKYIFLWSVPNAIAFYEKLGFEKTDILEKSTNTAMRFLLPEYNELFKK